MPSSLRPFEPMSDETATAVFDVLVETVGASEHWRVDFAHRQTDRVCSEHRIIGSLLGMGGKFRRNTGTRRHGDGAYGEIWFVDAYPEDMNDERRAMIEATNARLESLRSAHESATDPA
jgi:hypothetical protein